MVTINSTKIHPHFDTSPNQAIEMYEHTYGVPHSQETSTAASKAPRNANNANLEVDFRCLRKYFADLANLHSNLRCLRCLPRFPSALATIYNPNPNPYFFLSGHVVAG